MNQLVQKVQQAIQELQAADEAIKRQQAEALAAANSTAARANLYATARYVMYLDNQTLGRRNRVPTCS
jgi:hypothetical protein